jgi:hypothetical protein
MFRTNDKKSAFLTLCPSVLQKAALAFTLFVSAPVTRELTGSLPLSIYVRQFTDIVAHRALSNKIEVQAPFFEVYDSAHTLVYHQENWSRNNDFFQGALSRGSLPDTAELSTAKNYLLYNEMFEIVPQFKSHVAEFLAAKEPTVVEVTISSCKSCVNEDRLALELAAQSEHLHIRMLRIVLEREPAKAGK